MPLTISGGAGVALLDFGGGASLSSNFVVVVVAAISSETFVLSSADF